jgi:hypothetical protein
MGTGGARLRSPVGTKVPCGDAILNADMRANSIACRQNSLSKETGNSCCGTGKIHTRTGNFTVIPDGALSTHVRAESADGDSVL